MTDINASAGNGARTISVWDPLVRLVHWSIALGILINAMSEGDKSLHEFIGYAALGLVTVRLLWGLIGPRNARFSSFPPNPRRAVRHMRTMIAELRGKGVGRPKVHLSHNPAGALMVYNLWLCIALLGVTGYMMGTVQYFGIRWVKDVHELIFNWLVLSIILHVGGVILDARRTGVALIGSMISGRKTIPDDVEIER